VCVSASKSCAARVGAKAIEFIHCQFKSVTCVLIHSPCKIVGLGLGHPSHIPFTVRFGKRRSRVNLYIFIIFH